MTEKRPRNRQLRDRRADGRSIRELARDFRISPRRVRDILLTTGGDPRGTETVDLEQALDTDLERERDRLQDRIRSDRRRLRAVLDEIEGRRIDRILSS